MDAKAGKVVLEAEAKTKEAEKRFRALQKQVLDLEKVVKGFASGEIKFDARGLQKLREEIDQVTGAVRGLGREPITVGTADAEAALAELQKMIKSIGDSKEAPLEIPVYAEKALKALQRIEADYEQKLRELRRLAQRVNPFEPLGDAAQDEALQMARALEQGERRFERAVLNYNRASRRLDFDESSRKARNLRENIRSAALELVDLADAARPAASQVEGGLERIERAANDARRAVDRMEDEIRSAGTAAPAVRSLSSSVGELVSAARGFIALEIAGHIREFAASAVTAARETELLKTRLETIAGGAEAADREFEFLVETANTWGLNLQALTKDYATFTAVLEKEGFTLAETRELYKGLAVAARGAGLSQDDLAGAIRGLLQVAGKGAAQMDELRQQIGERFPGAIQVLSEELGIGREELFKLSEAGELLADETIPKLVKALTENFGEAAARAALGVDAEFNRLATTFRLLQIEVGTRLAPLFIEAFSKILAAIENNEKAFDVLFKVVEQGFDIFVDLLQVVDGLLSGDIPKALKGVGSFAVDAVEISTGAFKILVGVLGGVLEKLAEVAGALPGIGDGAKTALEKAAAGLEGFEDQLDGWLGDLDEIRDGLLDTGEEGKTSAEKIRKSLEDTLAALAKISEESDAAGRQSAKAAKKAEKAWLGLAEALREAFDEQPSDAPEPASPRRPQGDGGLGVQAQAAADLRKSLQDLREEKRKLEAQYSVSAEDLNRLDELSAQIFEAEQAVRNLGDSFGDVEFGEITTAFEDEMDRLDAAARARGEKIAEVLSAFVGSEDFTAAFGKLSEEGQSAVQDVLARIQDLSASGIDDFGSLRFEIEALVASFEAAGGAHQGLSEKIRSAFGSSGGAVDDLRDKIDRLGESAKVAGDKARGAGGGTIEFGGKVIEVGRQSNDAAEDIIRVGDEIVEVGRKGAESAGGLIVMGEHVVRVGDWSGQASDAVKDLANQALEAGASLEEMGGSASGQAEALTDAERRAKAVDEALAGVDRSSTGAATAMGDVAEQTRRISEAAKEAIEESEAVAEGVEAAGEASSAAAPDVGQVAEASNKAADGLERATGAAKALGGDLEVAGDQAGEAAGEIREAGEEAASTDGFDRAGEQAKKAGEGYRALRDDAQAASVPLGVVQRLVTDTASGLESLVTQLSSDPLGQLATSAGTLGEQAPQLQIVAQGLTGSAEALRIMSENLPAVQESLSGTVATMTEANEAGTITQQAKDFGELSGQLSTAATSLETIATSIEAYVSGASDVEEASSTIKEAIGQLTESSVIDGLRDFGDLLREASSAAREGAGGFVELNTETQAFVEGADRLIETLRSVAEVIKDVLRVELQGAGEDVIAINTALSETPWAEWAEQATTSIGQVLELLRTARGEAQGLQQDIRDAASAAEEQV
ncbi:MAG: tape measure protein [Acidobacteriota bacterium]